jgi:hypothetical protein
MAEVAGSRPAAPMLHKRIYGRLPLPPGLIESDRISLDFALIFPELIEK